MKEYLKVLKIVPLFKDINEVEINTMLKCLNAHKKSYKKNEIILMAGQSVTEVGIVLSGCVQIMREDISGNRTILARFEKGNLFTEAFVCSNIKTLPITVSSISESVILFVDYHRIITTCSSACVFHAKLIKNMMAILADKNIMLSGKIEHLSKRTTKEKLLSYLSEQAAIKGNNEFTIPFNRQELADYLCVDRSAMSNELCKLRDEGILSFHRNNFMLYKFR
jgi:CRP-like cAMP-binding protein